ncbi:PepSY-associated TM helix domain-containing protein [Microbulbifer sp. VVAC002]|uniref:PepSY-associated TM helix domain-containing protein n=1 Tax=Microbulbifer sp. VVAC002 TaxID=3243387 RepID=UPI004039A87A
MQQRSNILFYEIHSWIGVLFSILLFVISFSGVVALFGHELTQWERPEHRIAFDAEAPVDVDQLVAPVLAEANIGEDSFFMISMPDYYHPMLEVLWTDAESEETEVRHINPNTGEVLPSSGSDFAELLTYMHTDLLFPRPFGRYLVGLMGLVMLLSILSGIIIHKKIFKEMFKFRVDRSRRLKWTDLHKVLGVWPLPFHIVIAFTGAILGLNGIMIQVAAFSAFEGNVEAAVASVVGEHPEITGEPLLSNSYNQMLLRYHDQVPNAKPKAIYVEAYGDRSQVVQVSGQTNEALVRFVDVKYRSEDGEVVNINNPVQDSGPFMRVYFSLTPLHYALYGGFLIKALYFVLGLALCLMMVTGTVIWQVRKAQRQKLPSGDINTRGSGWFLSLLTVGVCAGLVVATAATFYANKLLPPGGGGDQRFHWIEMVYLSVWGVAIAWAMLRRQIKPALADLSLCAGLLLCGIPLLNALVTGNGLLIPWKSVTLPVVFTDLGALVMGVICLYSSRYIYRQVSQSKQSADIPQAVAAQ